MMLNLTIISELVVGAMNSRNFQTSAFYEGLNIAKIRRFCNSLRGRRRKGREEGSLVSVKREESERKVRSWEHTNYGGRECGNACNHVFSFFTSHSGRKNCDWPELMKCQ